MRKKKYPSSNSSKVPRKDWIGKTIQITKSGMFDIISGSPAHSVELFKGQKLKIVGVQEGNWLLCKLLHDVYFRAEPGIQMSELEREWHKKEFTGKIQKAPTLVIGISLNFDRNKFKVVKK